MEPSLRLDALYAAIDAAQWERLAEFYDPAAVYERPGYARLCGLDSIVAFYAEERPIRSGLHSLEGAIADSNQAAAWGMFDGETRDGRHVQERFADTFVLDAHRIVYRRSHFFRPAI